MDKGKYPSSSVILKLKYVIFFLFCKDALNLSKV